MTTKTHTYSDGSTIEQGSLPGRDRVSQLKSKAAAQPRKRKVTGFSALRVDDLSKPA